MDKILYIKGSKEHGKHAIELLEKLGGVNSNAFDGTTDDGVYFIDSDKTIKFTCCEGIDILRSFGEEILNDEEMTVWEPSSKIGDFVRVYDSIGEEMLIGRINSIDRINKTYTVRSINGSDEVYTDEESFEVWSPYHGDKVLVRENDDDLWVEAVYSFLHHQENEVRYYVVGGANYAQCIPYTENYLGWNGK